VNARIEALMLMLLPSRTRRKESAVMNPAPFTLLGALQRRGQGTGRNGGRIWGEVRG
jgi:hypothetical protein